MEKITLLIDLEHYDYDSESKVFQDYQGTVCYKFKIEKGDYHSFYNVASKIFDVVVCANLGKAILEAFPCFYDKLIGKEGRYKNKLTMRDLFGKGFDIDSIDRVQENKYKVNYST